MTKRIRPALVVYAILLVIAAACILYYQFAGARQTAVHYDYTLYFWNLLCMRPLLYGSLAALIAELLQQAGILRLPHKAKGICLALAVLLIALYAIVVALNMAGTAMLIKYTLWLIDWPQIFLVPGFLIALALYRSATA
ncbi:hypothetical protein LI073_06630 [bacterium 210917-SL.2.15]|nr:hypothetical protein [bacterium 210917-SL.2.15]